MKKYGQVLMIVLVVATLWGCATTESKKDLAIDRTGMITVTATVEAVDMTTRLVNLRGPEGRSFTVYAGKEVINLPQVRVGDKVVVVYSESLAVRMAKPGEVRDETSQGIGRATQGNKPGALEVIERTVTAKIENIDRVNDIVSLRMADGDVHVVKVMDPANLEKVKVGDTIVITYTEALAVSFKKT